MHAKKNSSKILIWVLRDPHETLNLLLLKQIRGKNGYFSPIDQILTESQKISILAVYQKIVKL